MYKLIAIALCIFCVTGSLVANGVAAQANDTSKPAATVQKIDTSEPGWILSMFDSRWGKCRLFLTKSRAVMESGFLSYFVLPPDYSVITIASNETKTFTRKKIERWTLDNFGQRIQHNKPAKLGKKTVAKIQCDNLSAPGKQQILWAKRIIWKPCVTSFCTTDLFGLKKELADAISVLSGVPLGYGFPMAVDTKTQNIGHTHQQQASAATQATIKSNVFRIPPGYKEVENELEIMFGSRLNKEHLDELMLSK